MKQLYALMAMISIALTSTAQTDSTANPTDTIRVGNIVIIRKGGDKSKGTDGSTSSYNNYNDPTPRSTKKMSNVSTNWAIVDLGFNNFIDQTDYAAAKAGQYLVDRPGTNFPLGASDLKLRASKSINVNIWFFMQRLNLVNHHINLKYGLGLELNNYRFRSDISLKEPGVPPYAGLNTAVPHAYIIRDSVTFSKNKLAADYLTVPLMINFCTHPGDPHKGLSVSLGVSAGYLYSQRNKQASNERGKRTNKGDYDLNQFKFSYVAELGLGPVRLYGSYNPSSIFNKGLDIGTYNVGVRLSNW